MDSSKRSLTSLRSAMEEVLQSDSERLMSETVARFQQAIEPFQEPNVLTDSVMPDNIETHDTSMEDIPYIETMQTMYSADNGDNRIDGVEEGPEILVNDRKKSKSDQEDKEDEDDQAIEIVFETHDGNDEYNPISPRTSKITFLNRVRELASESRDVTEENHVHFEGMESRDGHGQTRQDIDRDVPPVEEQSSSQAFNLYERSLSPIVEEHEPLPISSGSIESIDASPHADSADVFEVSEASHRGMVDNRQSPSETRHIQESMHEVGSTNDQNLETSKSVIDASSILVEANDMAAHIFSLTSGEESKKFFDEAQQKAKEIMSWFDGDQQKDEMFAAKPEQQVARCLSVDGTAGAQAKDNMSDQLQLENTEVAKEDSSTKAHPQTDTDSAEATVIADETPNGALSDGAEAEAEDTTAVLQTVSLAVVNETCSTTEVELTREVDNVEVTATSETTKDFLDSGAGTDLYLEVAQNSSPIVVGVDEKPQVTNMEINEEIFYAEEGKTAPEEEDISDATLTGDTTITLPKMAEAEINLDLLVYETGATVKADQFLLEAKEVAEACPAVQRQQVPVREDTTSATQGDGIEKKPDLWVDESMSLKVIDAADELKVDTAADTPTTPVDESTAVKVVDGAEKLQLDTKDVNKTVKPATEVMEVPDVDSETIVVGESATSTLLKTEVDVDQDISVDETVVEEAANDKVPIETGDLPDDRLDGSELKVVPDENGVEAIVMDETTRLFLEAELEAERSRLEVEAKVEAERLRLEAEAKKAIEQARLEAEAILEAERARFEAEAEAKAAAEIEALRKAAEAKALAAEEERRRTEEIEKVRLEVERHAGLVAEEATLLKREKEIEERARRKAEAEREQAIEEAKKSESARIRAEEEIARMRVEMEERMAEMARLEAERLAELGDDEASLARINAEAVLRRVREAEYKRKCQDSASNASSRFTSKIPPATSVASKEGLKSSVHERFVSHIPRASSTSSRSSKKGIEQSESNHSNFFSCGENPGSVCTQDYLTIYMRTSDRDEDELTLDLSDLSNQEEYDITTMESFATHWSSGTKKYIFESTPAFAKHAKALRGLGGLEHGEADNSDDSKSPPEAANKYVWSHSFYFMGAMTIVGIGTTVAFSPKYRAKIGSFDPKIVLSLAKVSLASAQDCIQTEYIAEIAAECLNAVRNHAFIEKAIKITMESIAAAKVHLKIGSC